MPYLLQKPVILDIQIDFFRFVGLFEQLVPYDLVSLLVSNHDLPTPHRKAQVHLLLLDLLDGCLLSQLLQLFDAFLVLFVLFLDLIADQTHVLASPDHWQLI